MPIRLVCPSCSAALSVKDEYAGRAVKCPKCAGVIPPSAGTPAAPPPSKPAAALPPPPPPEPEPEAEVEKSPFEAMDEPAKPKPKITARPTGRPVAKAASDDEDEEDTRPARRKDRDEDEDRDDEKRTRKGSRDKDSRPTKGKKAGGAGTMLTIIAVFGLFCCGGSGAIGYFAWTAFRASVEKRLNPKNDKVTFANYEKVTYGMTRSEVEAILGPGKLCTREQLVWVSNGGEFGAANPLTSTRDEAWGPKIGQGRVYIWQNVADAVVLAFYPDDGPDARVQMREFISKTGQNDMEPGTYRDDIVFALKFNVDNRPVDPLKLPNNPPGKKDTNPPIPGSATEITAEELAGAFDDNERAARLKYGGKTLIVSGLLNDRVRVGADLYAKLSNKDVACTVKAGSEGSLVTAFRGQKVRLRGRCNGDSGEPVMMDCEVLSVEPVEFVIVTADQLLEDFEKAPKDAQQKYANPKKLNYLHITSANVVAVLPHPLGVEVALEGLKIKKSIIDLAARPYFLGSEDLSKLKVGDQIAIKGIVSLQNRTLRLEWATVVP